MKHLAQIAVCAMVTGAAAMGGMYHQSDHLAGSIGCLTESPEKAEPILEKGVGGILPLEEQEYLVIALGEGENATIGGDTLLILTGEGEVVTKLDHCGMIWNGKSMSNAAVVSGDQPIVLFSYAEDGSIRKGIYSIKRQEWIQEPVYKNLMLLSNAVFTDGDENVAGKLMKLDGTVLSDTGRMAERVGNYISDGVNLYDLDGNYLFSYGLTSEAPSRGLGVWLREAWDDGILITDDGADGGRVTALKTTDGTTLWTEASGMALKERCGDFLSWTDGNGIGLITDMQLNPVLNEKEFYQLNSDCNINGSGVCLVSESENGAERLIQAANEPLEYWYYRCDDSWHIVEEYPKNQIYLEKRNDTCIPWYWEISEDGAFTVTNIWNNESVLWKPDEAIADQADRIEAFAGSIEINSAGSVIAIRYTDADRNYCVSINSTDGFHSLYSNENFVGFGVEMVGADLIEARVIGDSYDQKHVVYFNEKGEYLGENTDEVLYVNNDIRVSQNGEGIQIDDAEGENILALPLN